jgi:hypothetical protein
LDAIGVSVWTIAIGLALPLALLIFPTGRLESAAERVAVWIVGAAGVLFIVMLGGGTAAMVVGLLEAAAAARSHGLGA